MPINIRNWQAERNHVFLVSIVLLQYLRIVFEHVLVCPLDAVELVRVFVILRRVHRWILVKAKRGIA